MDLFAGIRVSDHETARRWYERLSGREHRDADGNDIGFGGVPSDAAA